MTNDPVNAIVEAPRSIECFCDGNGSVPCWSCGGEGWIHDCGEDSCCCADPQDDTACDICKGTGDLVCPVHE